jgi:hypothetical protein
MKLSVSVSPDLAALMAREVKAGQRAVTSAMRTAGDGLKNDWRAQVTGAGLGRRLAGAVRSESYPRRGESLDAAALVWSKAPEIMQAHDAGGLIRSRNGFWLAIPTPAAGRDIGGKRFTPGSWERRTGLRLRHVYRRGAKTSFLVAEARIDKRGTARASRSKTGRGVATVPIFILVPQVRLRPRLDLDRDARKWLDRVPGLIVDAWVDGKLGDG